MEPPATPRKPKRTADADAPENADKPAKPKTNNRASTTKPAPKPTASKSAAPKPVAGSETGTGAKSLSSSTSDPSAQVVRPAPKPTPAPTSTVPSPAKPVIHDDEPDLFKPMPSTPLSSPSSSTSASPSMAPAKPKGTVDPLSQRPSKMPRADGANIVSLLRTFLLRNGQVWRKTLSNASTSARTSASRLSKPVSTFRENAGKVTRSSSASISSSLDRWQKSLETSDTAVIVTTLALIAILIVVTVIIVLLIRR